MSPSILDRFFEKGRAFLGCPHPFICGAMTWVSSPRLVAAVCTAGGFACLAGGNQPVADLVAQTEAELLPPARAPGPLTRPPSMM